MRRIAVVSIAWLVACTAAPALHAEEPASGPAAEAHTPEEARREMQAKRREEMRRKIEIIRLARLTEELNLDAETAVRIIPVLKRFDALEEDVRRARQDAMHGVQQLLERGDADEEALRAAMNAFFEVEEAHVRQRRELFDDLGEVLTTEQQAQFMLFVPRFQRHIRRIARELTRVREERERDDRRWTDEERRPQARDRHGGPPPGGASDRPPTAWIDEPGRER